MEQENEEGGKKVIVAGYTVRPHFFFSEPERRLCIPVLLTLAQSEAPCL